MRLRDRLVASARFRRLAAAFPPTRPIARRRARALFDLATGFVHSQILLAFCRLDLPRRLLDGPGDVRSLARALRMEEDRLRRLLDAAASLGLARRVAGGRRYALGPAGAALIGQDGVLAMIEHHALLYDDLRDPVALLRNETGPTRIAAFWPYGDGADREAGGYSALMRRSLPVIADELLGSRRFGRARTILDVAGGDGAFLELAARRAKRAKLVLFDLPPVASLAAGRFRQAGLAGRAVAVGGDVLRDELPPGADLATLIRVLHDHDDDDARRVLAAVRRALAPGGTLLVSEPMRDTGGARAMGDAYFGFYLLAMGQGRPRSADELRGLLAEAGFRRQTLLPARMPLFGRTIVAR